MSAFDWLLVGHLTGDFLLQTERMARKERQASALALHIGAYGAVQGAILALLAPRLAVWAGCVAWLLITHAALDTRHPVRWWMGILGVTSNTAWLPIVLDQAFHVLTLVPVAVWLDSVAG
jgi:hypothetical protein